MIITIYHPIPASRPTKFAEFAVQLTLEDLERGAVSYPCPECEGTGDWTRFLPEPELGPQACVDCKGTGRRWAAL